MIKLAAVVIVATVSTVALAGNKYEVVPEACKGVTQEVERVSEELEQTSSRFQKEWLTRQLTALESKQMQCQQKGYLAALRKVNDSQ